jgi:hypothetical protein
MSVHRPPGALRREEAHCHHRQAGGDAPTEAEMRDRLELSERLVTSLISFRRRIDRVGENDGSPGSYAKGYSGALRRLVDVDQRDRAADDDGVHEQPDDGEGVGRVALARACVSRERWQHADQNREEGDGNAGRDEGRRTRFPSSAIAHSDPNRVAPKTSAKKSCSRASGSCRPSRAAALPRSKYRISQSSARPRPTRSQSWTGRTEPGHPRRISINGRLDAWTALIGNSQQGGDEKPREQQGQRLGRPVSQLGGLGDHFDPDRDRDNSKPSSAASQRP